MAHFTIPHKRRVLLFDLSYTHTRHPYRRFDLSIFPLFICAPCVRSFVSLWLINRIWFLGSPLIAQMTQSIREINQFITRLHQNFCLHLHDLVRLLIDDRIVDHICGQLLLFYAQAFCRWNPLSHIHPFNPLISVFSDFNASESFVRRSYCWCFQLMNSTKWESSFHLHSQFSCSFLSFNVIKPNGTHMCPLFKQYCYTTNKHHQNSNENSFAVDSIATVL